MIIRLVCLFRLFWRGPLNTLSKRKCVGLASKVLPLKERLSILIASHLRDVSGKDEKRKNIKPRFSFIADLEDSSLLMISYFPLLYLGGSLFSFFIRNYFFQQLVLMHMLNSEYALVLPIPMLTVIKKRKQRTDKLSTFSYNMSHYHDVICIFQIL